MFCEVHFAMRRVWQGRKQFRLAKLHRAPRGGKVCRRRFRSRFSEQVGGGCDEDVAIAHTRKRRRHQVGMFNAVPRERLRWCWESSLHFVKRWSRVGTWFSSGISCRRSDLRKFRGRHRGAAAGPSGMTSDHLRPVFDSVGDSHLLFMMGEQLILATGHCQCDSFGCFAGLWPALSLNRSAVWWNVPPSVPSQHYFHQSGKRVRGTRIVSLVRVGSGHHRPHLEASNAWRV